MLMDEFVWVMSVPLIFLLKAMNVEGTCQTSGFRGRRPKDDGITSRPSRYDAAHVIPSSNPASRRWRTLSLSLALLLALVYIFSFIDRQVLSILLSLVKQEFGASDTEMGLLTGWPSV